MKLGIALMYLFIAFTSVTYTAAGQAIAGVVSDAQSKQPLEGVSVRALPRGATVVTDAVGHFYSKAGLKSTDSMAFSCVGYKTEHLSVRDLEKINYLLYLQPQTMELAAITVSAQTAEPLKIISKADIAFRGLSNSQEVLRIVPGVVIGQHQGGGKAEQIFLRGFDCDHGTDLRLEADGIAVNLVSHAHGQGFADSHFIIPETIAAVDYQKGPYSVNKGDFATTGFVDYHTSNTLASDLLKVETGMYHYLRLLAMVNILGERARKQLQQSWYVAAEYHYSDAYFDNPQHLNRFNFFTKYTGRLSKKTRIDASASAFSSSWTASGQLPERAVREGRVSYFGALDPNEGGKTNRANGNVQLFTAFNGGGLLKNQLYYSNYYFDLNSNFTFFLYDTLHGDEIRQREHRNLFGYNGSYDKSLSLGAKQVQWQAGIQIRSDLTYNSELSHTMNRYRTLRPIKLGDIDETSTSAYTGANVEVMPGLNIQAGVRYDQFFHFYNNKLTGDTTLQGRGRYSAQAGTLSPKLKIYLLTGQQMHFYLSAGKGFHSNDTRAVVAEHGLQVLPSAFSVDLGAVLKPAGNIILEAAVWYIGLDQEFVYAGDGGTVEFNGKTRREGFDLSSRYQPCRYLFVDVDLNYAHGRALGLAKGKDYIPLAPVWTSAGGITYNRERKLSGSVRYRYLGDRPANGDYSLTAQGYLITDALVRYTWSKNEAGIIISNLLNSRWKETQFATVTRLAGEAAPIEDICFTPGTPVSLRLTFCIHF